MRMSWREYQLILQQYKKAHIEKLQILRLQCYWAVAPYFKAPIDIEDFMPIEGDKTKDERAKEFEEKALALIRQASEAYLANQKNQAPVNAEPS